MADLIYTDSSRQNAEILRKSRRCVGSLRQRLLADLSVGSALKKGPRAAATSGYARAKAGIKPDTH